MIQILDRQFVPYISKAEIQQKIEEMARTITNDFEGDNPVVIGVLNGVVLFFADLVRLLNFPLEIAFIKISSYDGMVSSGTIETQLGVGDHLRGRSVIVVEDIVDTGRSMSHIINMLSGKGISKVAVATLLQKPEALEVPEICPDYVGFAIDNRFVVGYGLDYNGYGRNLPEIYVLKED